MVFNILPCSTRECNEQHRLWIKVQGVDKKQRNEAAMKALSLVGLEAYAFNATRNFQEVCNKESDLLVLCSDPDILLMDEAFSIRSIDTSPNARRVDVDPNTLQTILFITHDLNEALRIGDRVCILRDGYVVQIGTAEEILTKPADAYVAEFVQDVDQGRLLMWNQ